MDLTSWILNIMIASHRNCRIPKWNLMDLNHRMRLTKWKLSKMISSHDLCRLSPTRQGGHLINTLTCDLLLLATPDLGRPWVNREIFSQLPRHVERKVVNIGPRIPGTHGGLVDVIFWEYNNRRTLPVQGRKNTKPGIKSNVLVGAAT